MSQTDDLKPKNILASVSPEWRFPSAFDAYVLFKSLPQFLRYPRKDRKSGMRPMPRAFAEGLGIEDESILCLIELQTQKNFAAKFGVTEQTLGRWNKKIAKHDLLNDMQGWARDLTKNVLCALYIKIMQGDAQPQHFKLWLEMMAGWDEKQTYDKQESTTTKIVVLPPVYTEPPLVHLRKHGYSQNK